MAADKKTRRPMKTVDPFVFYKRKVGEIFESQLSDFGMKHVATLDYMPDCVVEYRNESTGISLRYEWKSQVGVNLIKLERTRAEVTEGKSYDLLLLMEIRRPETDPHRFYGGDKEWTDEYIEKLLLEYATFLREGARDVLTGDFTVFSELRKLSAKYRRDANKKLFGTHSGGTPRFSSRPTLEQVFAGAKDVDPELDRLFGGKLNQDKTSSRIYEAYWDHQYSIHDIASFLNETKASIERALDEQDDLD